MKGGHSDFNLELAFFTDAQKRKYSKLAKNQAAKYLLNEYLRD